MFMRYWLVLVTFAWVCSPVPKLIAGQYALVVGVESYKRGQLLPQLQYAADDAQKLATELEEAGYEVTRMMQSGGQDSIKPDAEGILTEFIKVLGKAKNDDDIVIVALVGHSVQFAADDGDRRFFFCPADAKIAKVKSAAEITELNRLIEVRELYAELEKCSAGAKLLLLDTNRANPLRKSSRQSIFSLSRPQLPEPTSGTAVLASCEANQNSFEDKNLQSGVFCHQLLQGLKGAADVGTVANPADGEITLEELYRFASAKTHDFVRVNYRSTEQMPEMLGTFRVAVPLVSLPPKFEPGVTPREALAQQALNAMANQNPIGQGGGSTNAGGASQNGEADVAVFEAGKPVVKNSLGSSMVLVASGSYRMGSPATEPGHAANETQVDVRLTKDFWLGKYEVTQAEYRRLMGASPWDGMPGVLDDPSASATYVTWEEAMLFCGVLTDVEHASGLLPHKYRYDLPTEAQWEYACRAGTETAYYFGATPADLPDHAWYKDNAEEVPDQRFAHIVGLKDPNEIGLYDMHGNVREWCKDVFRPDLPGGSDPFVNTLGTTRVSRGGNWQSLAIDCRAAYRFSDAPIVRKAGLGFRVCVVEVETE